jgi:hypothetical protein
MMAVLSEEEEEEKEKKRRRTRTESAGTFPHEPQSTI